MSRFVTLDGTTYFSTPNAASWEVAGDLELCGKYAFTDPTPAAVAPVIACRSGTGGYRLQLETTGGMEARYYSAGPTPREENTSSYSIVANVATEIKVTYDLSGTSGNVIWYQDGVQVDTDSQSNQGAGISGGDPLTVAGTAAGAGVVGVLHYAEARDGIGGTQVARVDPDDIFAAHGAGALANGATWVGSVDGLTWTVNGTGAVVGPTGGLFNQSIAGPGQLLRTGG